ncbi:MAG: class I SAM-dependent methyltransferase [Nostoc sp. LLA-1]|nr:class I SAM-dependent methyltransferase [Cyanocohniella sp. LLY]
MLPYLSLANRLLEIAQPQPGQEILDVATGTGLVAIPAAQIVGSSGRVVGVDISKGMLEQAQRKITTLGLTNVELIEADADYLDFNDSSFDIIFCSSALVYLTDIPNSLQQWYRFLKPGGKVAFSCFAETAHTVAFMFRQKAQAYGIFIPNPNEPLGTPQKCQDLLKEKGFQNIEIVTEQLGFYLSNVNVEKLWNGNVIGAFGYQVKELPPERLEQLKAEYIAQVEATKTDKGIWNDATTFFVLGNK